MSGLVVVGNKLSQVTSLYQPLDCNFQFEALLGSMAMVFMISTILILVHLLWWTLQLGRILEQVLGLCYNHDILDGSGEGYECGSK